MNKDLWLYIAIGVLSFANAWTGSLADPHFWMGAALAGLLVAKAKRSPGITNSGRVPVEKDN